MSSEQNDSVAALMGQVRGVVFDKDGTLTDLDARWVPYFRRVISDLAAGCGDPTLVLVLGAALGVGDTFLVQDGPAAVDTPARIGDRIIAEASAHGHDPSRIAAMTGAALSLTGAGAGLGPLVPLGDIAETIRRLGARGYHLGIATTDVRSNTVRELTALGVADQLSAIRCGDDEAATKPDPAVLWQIASDWDLDASELLFVGDSRDDLLTARTAATPFVARCHPDRAPRWVTDADAVVASITELVVDDT